VRLSRKLQAVSAIEPECGCRSSMASRTARKAVNPTAHRSRRCAPVASVRCPPPRRSSAVRGKRWTATNPGASWLPVTFQSWQRSEQRHRSPPRSPPVGVELCHDSVLVDAMLVLQTGSHRVPDLLFGAAVCELDQLIPQVDLHRLTRGAGAEPDLVVGLLGDVSDLDGGNSATSALWLCARSRQGQLPLELCSSPSQADQGELRGWLNDTLIEPTGRPLGQPLNAAAHRSGLGRTHGMAPLTSCGFSPSSIEYLAAILGVRLMPSAQCSRTRLPSARSA